MWHDEKFNKILAQKKFARQTGVLSKYCAGDATSPLNFICHVTMLNSPARGLFERAHHKTSRGVITRAKLFIGTSTEHAKPTCGPFSRKRPCVGLVCSVDVPMIHLKVNWTYQAYVWAIFKKKTTRRPGMLSWHSNELIVWSVDVSKMASPFFHGRSR